jgi:hypothetical protein
LPGQLLNYDQETGDTLWFVTLPGSPSEPGWFGAPSGEIVPGSPVVFVPGPRDPPPPVHYGVGSGEGKGAAAFSELERYSRRIGASSSSSPKRTTPPYLADEPESRAFGRVSQGEPRGRMIHMRRRIIPVRQFPAV